MNRPAALVWFPRKVNLILGAVRIEQSLFALPYGYLAMLLAAGGLPTGRQFLWITVAMFSARTVGFVTNRVLDRSVVPLTPFVPDDLVDLREDAAAVADDLIVKLALQVGFQRVVEGGTCPGQNTAECESHGEREDAELELAHEPLFDR